MLVFCRLEKKANNLPEHGDVAKKKGEERNLRVCGEAEERKSFGQHRALHCQESQWDPGVHQEECGQQDEGGSPSPLHCPGEASSGVLCPVLGSPVQER